VIGRQAADQLRALIEAVHVIGAHGHDLDEALDALATQARLLLGAADVAINLRTASGGYTRRRPSSLATPGHPYAESGVPAHLSPLTPEAEAARRPLVVEDIHTDPRIPLEARTAFPQVVSMLVAPLVADKEVLGMMIVRWTKRRAIDEEDVAAADALGRHAAIAVHAAERCRLDGAVKTARALTHDINQHLTALLAFSEILPGLPPADAPQVAREIKQAARELAEETARLERIVRFVETWSPVGPMLDLDAATD
jgi:GAF domain-containing protein